MNFIRGTNFILSSSTHTPSFYFIYLS